MIVETTRILPAVVSVPNMISHSRGSINPGLNMIIDLFSIPHPDLLLIMKHVRECQNGFKQAVELIKLMLTCESHSTENSVLQIAVLVIINSALALKEIRERVTHIPGNSDPYDEMIEVLGDIFHYFVFVDPDRVAHILHFQSKDNDAFFRFFIYVAGYSSLPGRSKKLLHVILSALSVNTVNNIKVTLSRDHQAMKTSIPYSHKLRKFTKAALKCIRSVKTPFSLQAIARLAINRAIISRSLGGVPRRKLRKNLILTLS